jgi:hypothetical protein
MGNRFSYYDFVALIIPGIIFTAILLILFNTEIHDHSNIFKVDSLVKGDFLNNTFILLVFFAVAFCAGELLYILGEQLEKILCLAGAFYTETDIVCEEKQKTIPRKVIEKFKEEANKDCFIKKQRDNKIPSKLEKKLDAKYILTYGKLKARSIKGNRLGLFQSLAHFSRNLAALSFFMILILPISVRRPSPIIEYDCIVAVQLNHIFVTVIPYLPLIIFLILVFTVQAVNHREEQNTRLLRFIGAALICTTSILLFSYYLSEVWALLHSTVPKDVLCTGVSLTIVSSLFMAICHRSKLLSSSSLAENTSTNLLLLLLYTSFLSSSWLIRGSDYSIPYLFIAVLLIHLFLIMNFTETFKRYFLELFCCINQSFLEDSIQPKSCENSRVQ